MFQTPQWDMHAFIAINQKWRDPVLDVLMPLCSEQAILWIVLVVLVSAALYKKHPRLLLNLGVLLCVVGAADGSTNFVKHAIDRVRPYHTHAQVWHISQGQWSVRPDTYVQTRTGGRSYPSAHAANSMALAMGVMILWRQSRPWMLLLPLLAGYSRIYMGKHYPVDVVAGWFWGAAVGGMLALFYREMLKNRLEHWLLTRLPRSFRR
ncbi:MAG: phosphatase PAP2 family protein [Desulfovibrionales bacterium]